MYLNETDIEILKILSDKEQYSLLEIVDLLTERTNTMRFIGVVETRLFALNYSGYISYIPINSWGITEKGKFELDDYIENCE